MTTRRVVLKYNEDISGTTSQSNDEEEAKRFPKRSPLLNRMFPNPHKYHTLAFILTFFSYAFFHATRKTFSNVKVTISSTWTPENTSLPDVYDNNWNGHNLFKNQQDTSLFLGVLDTVFMTSYAFGLFVSGAIGDRLNLKYVLAFGMCSSSFTVFLFGVVPEWCHFYNKAWYVSFWTLTGLLQSTGWPTVVAVIGNWFGKSSRGFVMGVWGASPSVGNILGTAIVNQFLHYGYEYSFLVTSSITFAFGIVILFSLIPSPRDVGLPCPDDDCSDSTRTSICSPDEEPLLKPETSIETSSFERPQAVGLCHACCLPGVLAYSLAYACLKFVNYSFFFWLPYYLQKSYGWPEKEADTLSMWYDVGGIIGGILSGYLSDKMETRSPVVGLMLLLSPVFLYIYSEAPPNHIENAIWMTITGIFISGVAGLISTAVSADLGRHPQLANNKEALSTVTGIIDGTGSFGAAIGQVLVPVIMNTFGWKSVFYVFMIMTLLTLVCILNIVVKDTIQLFRRFLARRSQETCYLDSNLINTSNESNTLNS